MNFFELNRAFTDLKNLPKIEFGNEKQINLLKKVEQYEKQMLSLDIDEDSESVKIEMTINFNFVCFECGAINQISETPDFERRMDMSDYLDESGCTCSFCSTEYLFRNGSLVVIGNPRHPEKVTFPKNK